MADMMLVFRFVTSALTENLKCKPQLTLDLNDDRHRNEVSGDHIY